MNPLYQDQQQNPWAKPEEDNYGWGDVALDLGIWAGSSMATKGMAAPLTWPLAARHIPKIVRAYNAFKKMPTLGAIAKGGVVDTALATPLINAKNTLLYDKPFEPFKDFQENMLWGVGMETALKPKILKSVLPGIVGKTAREGLWNEVKTLGDVPLIPNAISNTRAFGGRETVREIFQPAVERMAAGETPFRSTTKTAVKGAAEQVRATARGEYGASHHARVLATELSSLGIEERNAAYALLKRGIADPQGAPATKAAEFFMLPQESQKKISGALRNITDYLGNWKRGEQALDLIREKTFSKELKNLFRHKDVERTLAQDPKYMKEIRNIIGPEERFDPKSASNTLLKLISEPRLSLPARDFARSLYMLQEKVVENMPRAAQKAEKSVLKAWVESNSQGLLSAHDQPLPKGFVRSKLQGWEGMGINKDLELAFQDLEYTPKLANSFYNKFFLTPWKIGKVVFSVPTHFRNTFSNIVTNDWGGLPWYRGDVYWSALKDLRTQSKTAKEFERLTGIGTTFIGEEFTHFPRVLPPNGSAFDLGMTYLENVAGKVSKPFAQMYQKEEALAKLAKYKWNLMNGMNKREAAADAVKWTFNYGEVTPVTKWARTSVMPFATWTAKIMPLMMETAVKNPVRLAKWASVPYGLTQLAIKQNVTTREDWEDLQKYLPEYLKEKGPVPMVGLLPFRDSKGRLNLMNYTWLIPGLGDVAEFGHADFLARLGLQNPLLSFAADIGRNKTFSGAPVYNDWDDPQMKAWKVLTHGWGQMMPALLSSDIVRFRQMVRGEEGAVTPGQYALGMAGLKSTPIDEGQIRRKWRKGMRYDISEAKAARRRELNSSINDKEREAVMEKYRTILQGIRSGER